MMKRRTFLKSLIGVAGCFFLNPFGNKEAESIKSPLSRGEIGHFEGVSIHGDSEMSGNEEEPRLWMKEITPEEAREKYTAKRWSVEVQRYFNRHRANYVRPVHINGKKYYVVGT